MSKSEPARWTRIATAANTCANHPFFGRATISLILVNAALMGIETYPGFTSGNESVLRGLHAAFQAVFVLEIAIRIAACLPRPGRFFRDGWNVFDFAVVALSLLPAAGPLATIARVARVLRIARLISALPDLRLIVDTMLRSIPSMGNVVLLQGLLVYVYGVLGWHLFAEADPAHWGTLGRACASLFQILTLEGWVEMAAEARGATRAAWIFFASYIVIAVFVVINLFIAVVLNNLEKSRRAAEDAELGARVGTDVESRLVAAEKALAELRVAIEKRASG
ncbi:MAG: ion transporter [Planctomycetota bacterium]|nr:ion transporter [Planctomycetota bacterium]